MKLLRKGPEQKIEKLKYYKSTCPNCKSLIVFTSEDIYHYEIGAFVYCPNSTCKAPIYDKNFERMREEKYHELIHKYDE